MKKVIYALVLPLVVVSGLVFANRQTKSEDPAKSTPTPLSAPKPLSAAEKEAERKKWEATPGGVQYKNWESSPEGKKVLASAAKISKQASDSSDMEAVITSLSLPPGSRLGFGVMARINGEDYIISFGGEPADKDLKREFQQLYDLKVNDKIILRSHAVSHAPKYAYPIITGDYVERDGKIIYKRPPYGKGC